MRKFLCGVLALAICNMCIFSYVYAEETDTGETKNLQTQQEELQKQIDEANSQLEVVQDELSQNLQQVQKLDEKIENSQSELEQLNLQIQELQTSIDEVAGKLDIAQERYDRQQKVLDTRLVEMYETGETNYLDVLLSSRTISDFLSNYYLVTELATYDTDLLDDMKEQKNAIESEKKTLDNTQNKLATIKENQTKTAKILANTKLVRENFIEKLSDDEKNLQTQIDEYNLQISVINKDILSLALGSLDSKYIGGELAWPVPGYTRVTSKYGSRYHPILHYTKLHTGIDIGAPMGASFVAANDGVVIKAEYNGAYGNMVIVDHGGGVSTLYAHGSEIMVKVGDSVKKGETVVLKVGSTGYSTGAHAHFEVRLNGMVTDPLPYITNGLVPKTQENNVEQAENTMN